MLADVERGVISLPFVRFIQEQRDGLASATVDLDTYRELRSAAEVGLVDTADIEQALANGALGSGNGAVRTATDLIDLAESAERQGGIFRRRDFKEAEDLLSLSLRGVTRDAPITILEDPGDEKANEFVLVTTSVRRQVLSLLDQGTPADQINPFALYGAGLRAIGATRPRPEPTEVAGPLSNLSGRLREAESAAEIEVIIEALRGRIAERDTQDARDQLAEARRYLGAIQRWQTAQRAAEALINAIPREERR